MKSGLTTEQAVVKLKLSKPPLTGVEDYQYLQQLWKQEQTSSLKDFLRWYNNKDVVSTLEAMQKKIAFYHDKIIEMLKLGCTLPDLANICLHKSFDAKFYPFTEGENFFWKKIREDVVGGPSIVFTRKAMKLMKFLFENQKTYGIFLLGLMQANYTPTRCVNPYRRVFIRIGISNKKRVNSYLDTTRPAALKIWSCLICKGQDQNMKFKAS